MHNKSAFNPSPRSVAYTRQWIGSPLVQIMACRLFKAKPLSKPMLGFVNWTLKNKLQWNFNQYTKLFIHEKASENIVCEMAAILSRGTWVNYAIDKHGMAKPVLTTITATSCFAGWKWAHVCGLVTQFPKNHGNQQRFQHGTILCNPRLMLQWIKVLPF